MLEFGACVARQAGCEGVGLWKPVHHHLRQHVPVYHSEPAASTRLPQRLPQRLLLCGRPRFARYDGRVQVTPIGARSGPIRRAPTAGIVVATKVTPATIAPAAVSTTGSAARISKTLLARTRAAPASR